MMKIVPMGLQSMNDLLLNRLEEIEQQLLNDHEYKNASNKITVGYNQIKEKDPELFRIAILTNIDEALGCIEYKIRDYYYRQGLKDALELKESLNNL